MATRLPLHEVHARLGARFVEAQGLLLPADYGDPAAEYQAVREAVGLLDRSGRGAVEATGRDRASFLHGMLSSDVKGLDPGQGRPAAFLDAHGKIHALLAVHCLSDRLVLEMDRALVAPTLAGLDRFLFSERVELEDVSDARAILTVAGPAARATVEKLLDVALPDLAPLHHAHGSLEGEAVRVARSDESGEVGYDLWLDPALLPRAWQRVLALGARPVGREAWNVLRVEAGVVWHGVDVDASTLVMEAPLEHAYSLDKGCYLGQEVIARVTYRGHVNRKVVGFRFPDARLPAPGAPVRVEEREVGRITSPVLSPALGRGLALGVLRREHWEPGTRVQVAAEPAPLAAEVAALPFHRRAGAGA
jgi:folate-binding protein YgfZ